MYIVNCLHKCNCGEINEKIFLCILSILKNLYKKNICNFLFGILQVSRLCAQADMFQQECGESFLGLCGERTCCLWRKVAQPSCSFFVLQEGRGGEGGRYLSINIVSVVQLMLLLVVGQMLRLIRDVFCIGPSQLISEFFQNCFFSFETCIMQIHSSFLFVNFSFFF